MVILCSAAGLLVATSYIMACSHTPCYLLLALPPNLRNGTAMQWHLLCQPYLVSMPSDSEWRLNKQYRNSKMILQEQNSYEFHDILYARWDYIFPQKDLFPAGFEPATLCVWSTRDNRYTKETWQGPTSWKVGHTKKKIQPSHLGIEPRTFGLEVQRAILCANGT